MAAFKRLVRWMLLLCLATTTPAAIAAQQVFPDGPVTIVVGFTPGGSNDVVARIIAPKVSKILGVPVIIENRPGSAGAIGAAYVANAKPDGQIVTLGSISVFAIGPLFNKNLPYKPADLQAVSMVASSISVLAVNPKLPVKTFDELLEYAKHHRVSMASSGVGGQPHLNIEYLRVETGGDFLHVAYKGAAGATVDVVGGQVDGIIMDYSALQGAIGQKQLRALAASKAVNGIEASKLIMMPWYGVMTSARVPSKRVHILHDAFTRAMADPDVLKQLAPMGIQPFVFPSPEESGRFITSETEKLSRIVKTAGLAPE